MARSRALLAPGRAFARIPATKTFDEIIGQDARTILWGTLRDNKTTRLTTKVQTVTDRKVGSSTTFNNDNDPTKRPTWDPTGGPNGMPCTAVAVDGDYLAWSGTWPLTDFSMMAVVYCPTFGTSTQLIGNKGAATNAALRLNMNSDGRLLVAASSAAGANAIQAATATGTSFYDQWFAAIVSWNKTLGKIILTVNGGDDQYTAANPLTTLADTQFSTAVGSKAGVKYADVVAANVDIFASVNFELLLAWKEYAQARYAIDMGV